MSDIENLFILIKNNFYKKILFTYIIFIKMKDIHIIFIIYYLKNNL